MTNPPVKNERAAIHAERLREALGHAQLTAKDLATILGVSEAAVSRWLAGTREAGPDLQIAISRALGVPVPILFPRMTASGERVEWR